jgi:hypothetical protein
MVSVLRSARATESVPIVALASDPQDFKDVLDRGATACLPRWQSSPVDLMDRLDEILRRLRY